MGLLGLLDLLDLLDLVYPRTSSCVLWALIIIIHIMRVAIVQCGLVLSLDKRVDHLKWLLTEVMLLG